MKKTILLTTPNMIPSVDRFRHVFEHYDIEVIVPDVKERLSEAQILEYAGQFDGTICGDDYFTEKAIKSCLPRLKVITKWGTGIDSIDKEAATRLGVPVRNTTNAFTLPVSETVLGYILCFARQLPFMDRFMRTGGWSKLPSRSLSECTLGVIGVGNIGSAVIRRARVFGMKILATDIVQIKPDFVIEQGFEVTSLDDLAQRADFISVNCDLNPTSYHLVNEKLLNLMKPEAVLINTARGPIVDEKALVQALQEKKIAGAGLDVFEDEPLPQDSPLRTMDNVLMGSHNSNNSPAAWERVHWNSIRMLLESLEIPHADLDDFIP